VLLLLVTGLIVEEVRGWLELASRASSWFREAARASDVVDACVVEGALRSGDLVVSSDEGDLRSIAAATGGRLEIDRP
jgi:hypothetical protein